MAENLRVRALRDSAHPLYNDRKLKLGTFCANTSSGLVMSTIDGMAQADWQMNRTIAQLADEMEFEAQVPLGRYLNFGGPSNHNGESLEVFTWAAAVGAVTRNSAVFATSHFSTVNPLLAAKQGATIDQITNGRFALNLVCGWRAPEMAMFGLDLLPHDERYAAAGEWLEIVKRLWSEDGYIDFAGKYFKVTKAELAPKPICKPYPPVMCAGASETGRHFAAKNCDIAFVGSFDGAQTMDLIQSYRDLARNEYGRDLKIWTYGYVVQAESEKEARAYYDYYVHEKGDWQAAQNVMVETGFDKFLAADQLDKGRESFVAGTGSYPMIGTPDQIVDRLQALSDAGVDGVLLTWPRYLDGIRSFKERTLPLLRQAGLR